MPTYEYQCSCNKKIHEIIHSIKCEDMQKCPKCHLPMKKLISNGFYMAKCNLKPTIADLKENNYKKKTSDLDRAIKSRRKAFGSDEVPIPVDKPDPKHVFKKGRVLAGQDKTVDKQEFIKAAAKDPMAVESCLNVLKKKKN